MLLPVPGLGKSVYEECLSVLGGSVVRNLCHSMIAKCLPLSRKQGGVEIIRGEAFKAFFCDEDGLLKLG